MNTNEVMDGILGQIKQPLWENWYIKEKIGSGSFCAVYRVEAKRLDRIDSAALKIEPVVLDGQLVLDPERKKSMLDEKRRFLVREASIMLSLRECPNIVRYEEEDTKELYIDNEFVGYYVLIRMELLQNVYDMIMKKRFDFSEANVVKLAEDIGNALLAAHKKNIIHRDIKPANFFVSNNGTYKLGDFNIAKRSDSSRTFAGTEGYIAPEIYRAKADLNNEYTNQADIYSLGICLYQMMNGGLFPFEEGSSFEEAIEMRMMGKELSFPKNVSEQFGKIILKACAYEPQNRYRNIQEMLDDLRIYRENLAGQGRFDANKTVLLGMESVTGKTAGKVSALQHRKERATEVKTENKFKSWIILVSAIALCVTMFVCTFLLTRDKDNVQPVNNPTAPTLQMQPTYTPTPKPAIASMSTPEPTATSTPTPEPTATSSPTPEPTATSTPTPEPTATNTPTPEPTATSTPTPTPTATNTPTPEPTATSTPTPEPTATSTPTPTPTATPKPTSTPTPKPTATPKPTSTPTPKPTATPKPTSTPTPIPHTHDYGWKTRVTKEATCTVSGEEKYMCSCGAYILEAIPAKGHREEPVAGKDATCTEDGFTAGKKCSECGVVIVVQTEILASGHHYDNDCDVSCNKCGETRVTQHKYDNDNDESCNVCNYIRFILSEEVVISAISYQWLNGTKYENSEPYISSVYTVTPLPSGAEWVESSKRTVYRYTKYYFYDNSKMQSGAWWYAKKYASNINKLSDSWSGLKVGCGKYNLELSEEMNTAFTYKTNYGGHYWGEWVIIYGKYKIYK